MLQYVKVLNSQAVWDSLCSIPVIKIKWEQNILHALFLNRQINKHISVLICQSSLLTKRFLGYRGWFKFQFSLSIILSSHFSFILKCIKGTVCVTLTKELKSAEVRVKTFLSGT